MKFKTSLLTALFLFLSFSVAQAAEDSDVIQAWVSARYQRCDSSFNDLIQTSLTPFQLVKLRSIENGTCATSTSSPACIQDLNNLLNSAYSSKADTYGCVRQAAASTPVTVPASKLKVDANIVCQPSDRMPPGRAYEFTRQTGSSLCHKKFDCPNDFSYVGQNFSSGTYDFTCLASADSCKGVGLGEGSCTSPTIQAIGLFTDGKVQKLSYPTEGAQ